jgi:hypothetical protein
VTDNPNRALGAAAFAFACATGFGSAVAIRDDVTGEPLHIRVPLSVPSAVLVGWGAGVAAPWPMPAAALWASRFSRREGGPGPALICSGLGIGCIVGTLIEPVTYRRASWTRATRAAILLNVTASVALAVTGIRQVKRLGGVHASLGGHNELKLNIATTSALIRRSSVPSVISHG